MNYFVSPGSSDKGGTPLRELGNERKGSGPGGGGGLVL